MDSQALLLFHVAISLIGIASGLIVLYGLLTAQRMGTMTALFLATTIATSATGFLFHRDHLLPSQVVGVISLVLLAIACYALYARRLRGGWRAAYVTTAVMALYLNVFVLVAQAFLKVPALHALAPNGSEPPFAIAQGLVLVLFVALGFQALRRFRPASGFASPLVARI
ncbi:MAG TPA: hypothetical protein VF132_09020 [Rudaea sp.]